VITRVISEYTAYVEDHIQKVIYAILFQGVESRLEEVTRAMQFVSVEARGIEARLAHSAFLAGEQFSAADIVIFPGIQMLLRVLDRREAQDLRSRWLPLDLNYPAIAAWIKRVEALPGYEKTYPPHWRE
jgi:glutathione S-transferase